MNKTIPLVDLTANYLSLKKEIDLAIQTVINETAFIGGSGNKFVTQFEDEFSNYLGVLPHNVVSCANGTDAIEIVLQALGIGKGDEVLIPALTWISTAEAVVNVGATPIFVDIDLDTYTIKPDLIENKITAATKAIIAVHLYGCPADVDAINQLCKKHQLLFLEDCAQAHGAMVGEKMVGTFGDAATFSFYPGKNLGAFGDAGAIVIKDTEKAEKARQIANHGQKIKHNHLCIGRNSRLDGIQAAILSAKLPHLTKWNALRLQHATYYNQLIKNNFEVPVFQPNVKHVFHLYVIKTNPEKRNELINYLNQHGVATAIHYPVPLSEMAVFKQKTICPNAKLVCASVLSLPIYPELTPKQIEKIAVLLNDW